MTGRETLMPSAGCVTARAEVTDRMLIAGQRHLRAVLEEYAAGEHRPARRLTTEAAVTP
jgi:hypothetical protein